MKQTIKKNLKIDPFKVRFNTKLSQLTAEELLGVIKYVNFMGMSNNPDDFFQGKSYKTWNEEAVLELGLRCHEEGLEHNLRKGGNIHPISRPKYVRLMELSDLIINDIFTIIDGKDEVSLKKEKFKNLQLITK